MVRIEIKRNADGRAVIISFDTHIERFESANERNKFFRGLYGWEQVVSSEHKRYVYRRPGLLDDVPYMKISESVFMIANEHMKRVQEYFDQWHEKVEFEMLEVMLQNQRILRDLYARKAQQAQHGRNVEIEGE